MSCVMCHVSGVNCNFFMLVFIKKIKKIVFELGGGGYVIHETYRIQFLVKKMEKDWMYVWQR